MKVASLIRDILSLKAIMQIEEEHSVKGLFVDDYKMIGFPFFNRDNRMEEFEKSIDNWLIKL